MNWDKEMEFKARGMKQAIGYPMEMGWRLHFCGSPISSRHGSCYSPSSVLFSASDAT